MEKLIEFEEFVSRPEWLASSERPVLLIGIDGDNNPVMIDLVTGVNLLVAGAAGTGKTNLIHCMIAGLIRQSEPDQVQLVLVVCKAVDLDVYDGIPYLRCPILESAQAAQRQFCRLLKESRRRCRLVGSKTFEEYNAGAKKPLPRIVVLVDELVNIMALNPDKIEELIVRIAQKSAQAGMHLVLCTGRPDVRVLTGSIKANCSVRIAFRTKNAIDSRTILDQAGAEELSSDVSEVLFASPNQGDPLRVRVPHISSEEIEQVALSSSGRKRKPAASSLAYLHAVSSPVDDLFPAAVEAVRCEQRVSIAHLQRSLRLGYTRASRLMDLLEEQGVVGPPDDNRYRLVLEPQNNNTQESSE